MQSQAKIRIAKKNTPHPFFIRLEQYFHDPIIDGMDVNQYIASFGKPQLMSNEVAAEIASAMSRAAMESAWKYYAIKPDPAAFNDPPPPENADNDSIPPKRHFLLCLTQPGITETAIAAAIDITANAIRTGKLISGMALEIDAPTNPVKIDHQFRMANACANLLRAIGIGNQRALAERRSYHSFSIRFHVGTLSEDCIDSFSDSLASGQFPDNLQILLPVRDLQCAARLMFAYPEKEPHYPADLTISFMDEKTPMGATSHRNIYTMHHLAPAPTSESESGAPLSHSQNSLFPSPEPNSDISPEAQFIDDQLEKLWQLYTMKLDSRSLEHQLNNLHLLQEKKSNKRFQ